MTKFIFIAIVLAVIGIGMIVAGISNLRADAAEEKTPNTKHSKGKNNSSSNSGNELTNWIFGNNPDMDPKRMGRARINIGIIFIFIALVVTVIYIF